MPTANAIVKGAMRLIGALPSGQDPSSNEITDGIETMNDYMLELAGTGINLGYHVCAVSTDETMIPDYAVAMVKSNLAVRLASEYGRQVLPSLAVFAANSMDAVLNNNIEPNTVHFPDTLPIGEDQSYYDISKYFTDQTLSDIENELGVGLTDDEGNQLEYESTDG